MQTFEFTLAVAAFVASVVAGGEKLLGRTENVAYALTLAALLCNLIWILRLA